MEKRAKGHRRREMHAADLGDLRLYEDEAIREQAAALQIHMINLLVRIDENRAVSKKTLKRIGTIADAGNKILRDAKINHARNPL